MRFLLPYPPTANLYWRVVRGIVVKSRAARDYQHRVKCALGTDDLPDPLSGPVVVYASLFRPRRRGDLDNTLKVLLDALKGVAFVDDDQVVEIHAIRLDDKANPRAEVRIEPQESRVAVGNGAPLGEGATSSPHPQGVGQ